MRRTAYRKALGQAATMPRDRGAQDMNDIILKHIKGEPVTDGDIEMALYEVCDLVHSSCTPECPVYKINGGVPLTTKRSVQCSCFKRGDAMLAFIREKLALGYSL